MTETGRKSVTFAPVTGPFQKRYENVKNLKGLCLRDKIVF